MRLLCMGRPAALFPAGTNPTHLVAWMVGNVWPDCETAMQMVRSGERMAADERQKVEPVGGMRPRALPSTVITWRGGGRVCVAGGSGQWVAGCSSARDDDDTAPAQVQLGCGELPVWFLAGRPSNIWRHAHRQGAVNGGPACRTAAPADAPHCCAV